MLILRGGAIGDLILTLPVFQAVRCHLPNARVEVVGFARTNALLVAAGLANAARSLDSRDAAALFAREFDPDPAWRSYLGGFDAAVSFLHDPDGVVAENLRQCGIATVLSRSPLVATGHATAHLLAPLAELGIRIDPAPVPELTIGEAYGLSGRRLASELGAELVALHPGSGSAGKNWPFPKFTVLAGRLREMGYTPRLIAGEAEAELRAGLPTAGVPVLPEMNLVDLAAFLGGCRGYVGNDSGVTHLAAVLGLPTVALFGPTDAGVWGPKGRRVRIVRAAEPTPASLAGIPEEAVLFALLRVMSAAS